MVKTVTVQLFIPACVFIFSSDFAYNTRLSDLVVRMIEWIQAHLHTFVSFCVCVCVVGRGGI